MRLRDDLLGVILAVGIVACASGLRPAVAASHNQMLLFWCDYQLFVLAVLAVQHGVPRSARGAVLALGTVIFAVTFLPLGLVNAGIVHWAVMTIVLRMNPSPLRLILFVAWMGAFNYYVPTHVLHLPDARLAMSHTHRIIIWIFLLWMMGWRSMFVYYEVAAGVVKDVRVSSLGTFLLGLPFLGGSPVALSYRHFTESQATTETDHRSAVLRGLWVCLGGMGLMVTWLGLFRVQGVLFPDRQPPEGLMATCALTVLWFLQLYLSRVVSEQGSVGICRLMGYNVRDDFAPGVLASKSPVDFWRGWNMLWREFVIAWIYYPMCKWLGRRYGVNKPWVVAVSALATFVGSVATAVFPKVCFCPSDPRWCAALAYAALANVIWGVIVSVNLYLMTAAPRRREPESAWTLYPKRVVTFALVCFLNMFKKAISLFSKVWGGWLDLGGMGD